MINLIDQAAKRDLKAARLNVVLATYCFIVGIALVAVVLMVLFSHWWLSSQISIYTDQKVKNESSLSSYNSVRSQGAEFSSNLNKIQSVLDSRTSYATALLNIAASLPAGAYINSIGINPATFIATPLKVTATTATNSEALALKQTLTNSKIYSKVNLDSVNCGGDNGNSCTVSLTVTLQQAVFTAGVVQ